MSKFIPTDEQWEKMKRHIKSDKYKKEDFFVFETLAVGDKIVPNRYMKLTLGYVYMILRTEINDNSMNFVFFIVSVNILPIQTNIQEEQLILVAPLSLLHL